MGNEGKVKGYVCAWKNGEKTECINTATPKPDVPTTTKAPSTTKDSSTTASTTTKAASTTTKVSTTTLVPDTHCTILTATLSNGVQGMCVGTGCSWTSDHKCIKKPDTDFDKKAEDGCTYSADFGTGFDGKEKKDKCKGDNGNKCSMKNGVCSRDRLLEDVTEGALII